MNDQELQDAEALGVDMADESDTEASDEGTVTITLSPEHVSLLRDILAQVDGGSTETEEDVGTEEGASEDEEMYEDEEHSMGEATEVEEIGHAIKDEAKLEKGLNKAKNNEVGTVKAVKGKADAKVTDKVGNDGTLADSKGESLIKPSNHKVSASKIKAGASAFE
jgi:hypothetical protein